MKKSLLSVVLGFALLLSGVNVAAAETTFDSDVDVYPYDLPHQH